jgi:hypothetical protein
VDVCTDGEVPGGAVAAIGTKAAASVATSATAHVEAPVVKPVFAVRFLVPSTGGT